MSRAIAAPVTRPAPCAELKRAIGTTPALTSSNAARSDRLEPLCVGGSMTRSATHQLAKQWLGALASAIVVAAGTASARDVCDGSGEMALRACQGSARADYRLASGKCLNESDAAAVKACNQDATAELRDALDTCQEQDDARDPVCARLGPAAYDPVIKPANFVAVIDNPY